MVIRMKLLQIAYNAPMLRENLDFEDMMHLSNDCKKIFLFYSLSRFKLRQVELMITPTLEKHQSDYKIPELMIGMV